MADEHRIAIGVDVGGSGIKVAAVDLATGELATTRQRVPTPQPSTPEAMIRVIAQLVKRASTAAKAPRAPIGVGMPCVILDGETKTAANIDKGWVNFPAAAEMSKAVGRPVIVGNDADLDPAAADVDADRQGCRGVALRVRHLRSS